MGDIQNYKKKIKKVSTIIKKIKKVKGDPKITNALIRRIKM